MPVENEVCVTKHAMEKYREFTDYSGPIGNTLTQLIYMLNGAENFEPDAEYKVKSLIRHKFRPTRYLLAKGYVMVIVNESLATLFKHKVGDKQMWRAY